MFQAWAPIQKTYRCCRGSWNLLGDNAVEEVGDGQWEKASHPEPIKETH